MEHARAVGQYIKQYSVHIIIIPEGKRERPGQGEIFEK